MKVVLPAPFGPMIERISPRASSEVDVGVGDETLEPLAQPLDLEQRAHRTHSRHWLRRRSDRARNPATPPLSTVIATMKRRPMKSCQSEGEMALR